MMADAFQERRGLFGDRALDFERINTERQGTFEERIVRQILTWAGHGARLAAYARECQDEDGVKLNCGWLNRRFPRFPVLMGTEKLPRVYEIRVGDLFGPNFVKTPMMEAYKKLQLQLGVSDDNERLGLVFGWPHVPTASTMVLHNYPIEVHTVPDPSLRMERNTRIVRPYGNPPVVYVIDPLQEFLLSIGKDWAEE